MGGAVAAILGISFLAMIVSVALSFMMLKMAEK